MQDVNEMYDPDLWPEGALVQQFYEPRHSGNPRAGPGEGDMRPRKSTAPVANSIGAMHVRVFSHNCRGNLEIVLGIKLVAWLLTTF